MGTLIRRLWCIHRLDYNILDYGVVDYGVVDYGVVDYSVVDYDVVDYGVVVDYSVLFKIIGAVAQMVERPLCMREVGGSMPLSSNNIKINKAVVISFI